MEAALEWADYRASLCSGCGHPLVESMDPANSEAYEAVPMTCYGCTERDAERRKASEAAHGDQFGKSAFDGMYIAVAERS